MSETRGGREMTLDEWVGRLPSLHRAHKELAALKAAANLPTQTVVTRDEHGYQITDERIAKIRAYERASSEPTVSDLWRALSYMSAEECDQNARANAEYWLGYLERRARKETP